MSFRDLYEYCQSLEPKISRNDIRDRALQLTGVNRVSVRKVDLDTSVCRGFYLSARNLDHPIVRQHGSRVIVLAREMNDCWTRFVYVKELMHIFGDPAQSADTGEKLETLLDELSGSGSEVLSPPTISEVSCFWMALAVLCPERVRRQLKEDLESNRVDEYAIALRLRIPQIYVRELFGKRYERRIAELLR